MKTVYLDIESSRSGEIVVIGFYSRDTGFVQHVWPDISRTRLALALPAADRLVTFNGNVFDLPLIRKELDYNLHNRFKSVDLRFQCKDAGLTGGLKRIEKKLRIPRTLCGLDGLVAQNLWDRYKARGDKRALETLCHYNREDVLNLCKLRARLRDRGVWL